MASSSLPENWACINGNGDSDKFEVTEIDSAILMSLLEESQGEECDDERLKSVIRSLEAEIDPTMMDGHDSLVELGWGTANMDGCQLSVGGQVDGQDCLTSHDLDFNWMELDTVPSSPGDEMTNWYVEPCGDEMDGVIEFGSVRDYSHMYYGIPLDENGYALPILLFLWPPSVIHLPVMIALGFNGCTPNNSVWAPPSVYADSQFFLFWLIASAWKGNKIGTNND
ncbi:hypothetical protein F0562_009063 [Nyssa sinensis]|uniref:Uncharacterized protein n=1 Tax=Nyssa sinensis TaxID=561372 RepID=A0A5J5A9J9_9ASTE|nr:hypothetical protein F0562_009063 [Nyssa sinensis]